MKKNALIIKITKTISVFLLVVTAVSCGSDDGPVTPGIDKGDISIATGTFTGTITVYVPGQTAKEYFNAEVTVTKVSDNQLKVTPKSGQAYSVAAPKTFQVVYSYAAGQADLQSVTHVAGSPEGVFVYNNQNKSLGVGTEQQSASEVTFSFDGTKQ